MQIESSGSVVQRDSVAGFWAIYDGKGTARCSIKRPGNRSPRFEPRALWPRPAPDALPQVLVRGQPRVQVDLAVSY